MNWEIGLGGCGDPNLKYIIKQKNLIDKNSIQIKIEILNIGRKIRLENLKLINLSECALVLIYYHN